MPKYVPVVAALLLAVLPAAATVPIGPQPEPSFGPLLEPNGARLVPAAPSFGPLLEPHGARQVPAAPSFGPLLEPHG